MSQSITEQSWEILRDVRRELGLDKAPEPDIEEVVLHERARPPGSSMTRRDKPKAQPYRKAASSKVDLAPRPSETQLKQWVTEEAKRSGLCYNTVWCRIRDGKYGVELRKVHPKLIYVRRIGPDPILESDPKPDEITFQQWINDQAKALGVTAAHIYRKVSLKLIATPPRRIVNAQISFVKVGVKLPFGESFETGLI